MNLDERVEVVAYDPAWPVLFARERHRVCSALGLPEADLEHIGSTAVPGLAAKPIVDLMLGVATYPPAQEVLLGLAELGYECLGEAGVTERLYCGLRGPDSFNLHVVRRNGEHWRRNLALRDYLRAHPSERERYAGEKRRAVASGASTLLAYSEAKSALVGELVTKALAWRQSGL